MNQRITLCPACGRRATEKHHARAHDFSQGKGMGGTAKSEAEWAEHDHLVELCADCHRAVHDKTLVLHVSDGVLHRVLDDGELVPIRAIDPDDSGLIEYLTPADDIATFAGSLVRFSDDGLAALWANGNQHALYGRVQMMLAAFGFHQRYARNGRAEYGSRWSERVADIIRDSTGTSVSSGMVYDLCSEAIALHAVAWDMTVAEIGHKALAKAGRSEDPVKAIAAARDVRDNGGTMTAAAAAIGNSAARELPCAEGEHVCRWCGGEFADWEEYGTEA